LEQYHHAYYNAHFEQAGFQIIERYFSSLDQEIKHNTPEVLQWEADFKAKGVVLRSIDLAQYEQELEKVYHFNMLAYQTNFLFSPISQESFIRKYIPLKNLINPALVLFAEDADKNMIGLFFCVEDFWNKNTKTLIVKSIARHPDAQWRGLGHVIGNQICKNALELGYQQIIHAFLRENGTSTPISQNYSGKVFKNYALYGKAL
jgi:L-amino acid N-acyltransferase YncA